MRGVLHDGGSKMLRGSGHGPGNLIPWTKAQRTGTRPSPDLYHWPVSLTTSTSRRPPPYQGTFSAERGAWATIASGDGSLAPFLRGRPFRLPTTTDGGSYRLASGQNRLTSVSRRRCRCANRAIS